MKTPMQEHIEWLKKERDEHGYERGLHYEMAIEHAESMLEKEKEVIMDAYDAGLFDGSMDDVDDRMYKDYYNETFKTKER